MAGGPDESELLLSSLRAASAGAPHADPLPPPPPDLSLFVPVAGVNAFAGSDRTLVAECLEGDDQAWSKLIDKYKSLIFSIPLRYGASRDDAADIFQSVCVELFHELPRLRKTDSLRAWIMTVAAHQSFHWKQKHRKRQTREVDGLEPDDLPAVLPPEIAAELEREQLVREAITRLPGRCQAMVRMLFWEDPPLTYAEVARRLGLATGSIGFIRGRCLVRLQKALREVGF
jgi:RNA polymerase sigma factor (sigma-70 family)